MLNLFAFVLTILLLCLLVLLKKGCACEICQSYLKSSWQAEFENLSDWYAHLLRRSPTRTIGIHVISNIITANPDNVEHILKTNFHNYPKGKRFSAILGDLLGKGIFNVDGDTWQMQRKMASLALGSLCVRSHAFDIVAAEITTRLVPLLSTQNDAVLDLQEVFRRFSFENACRFSFGLDPGCIRLTRPLSEFAAAFDAASRLSAERAMSTWHAVWKMKRVLNIGTERKLKSAIKLVNLLASDVIREKRRTGSGPSGRSGSGTDVLSRFMRIVDDDVYLRDIVVSFMLAGRDTLAAGLTAFFFLLATNRSAVDSIRAEIDRIIKPGKGVHSLEQMRDLHYLTAAVYESMRLYPPVQFDSKFCQNDDVLPDGTFVPSGTRVTYHPYAMGRMEKAWGSDCMEFRPERWLRDGAFVHENPFKYPVFQAGVRVCLGREMALIQMKLVALEVLRRFDISLVNPVREPRFVAGLTATFHGGLPVQIRIRVC